MSHGLLTRLAEHVPSIIVLLVRGYEQCNHREKSLLSFWKNSRTQLSERRRTCMRMGDDYSFSSLLRIIHARRKNRI